MTLICPMFADDLSFVTKTPDGNQHVLDETGEFCEWTDTMHLKPPKCYALACKTFTGTTSRYKPIDNKRWSVYDPLLTVQGQTLKLINEEGFKYLGKMFEIDMKERHLKSSITSHLKSWMDLVDTCLIDGTMKCWIYNLSIISKLSWWLTVGDLSLSLF